jgi:PAS domain S-box-containing protein
LLPSTKKTSYAGDSHEPTELELDLFFKHSLDIMVLIGFDYQIKQVSPSFERILGWKKEEVISKSFLDFLNPDDRESSLAEAKANIIGKQSVRFENRYRCKDGSYKWISWSSHPLPEKQIVIGLGRDITDHKKTEEAMQRSEEKYRQIVETAEEGIWTAKPDGTTIYVNQKMADMLGYSSEEIIGKVGIEFLARGQEFLVLQTRKELDRNFRHQKEFQFLRKDGTTIWTLANTAPIFENGRHIANIAMHTNITKRKKAESALREASEQTEFERKRLETILETTPLAVVIVDASSGKFSYANKRAMQLYGFNTLGLDLDEHVAKVKAKRMDGTDYPLEEMPISHSLKLGQEVLDKEMILSRPDGQSFAVAVSAAPLRDMKGNITAAIAVFEDITEHKRAQEALRQSAELARQRAEELEKLMDIIPAAVWVSRDPQCENITGNQAANNFYEASGGENVSAGPTEGGAQNSTRRFFRGNRELTPQELPMQEAAAKNVEIRNSELDVLLPSNRKITILGNAKPLLDNKGEVRGCLAVFMDVTERKHAEDTLKENEQLYRTVFDNSQDGFQLIELIYDENGKPIDHKFLKVNHAYEKIIGVKAKDILDKTAKYISPNQELHWLEVPDRVGKTGISEHVELYNKDINKTLDCRYFLYSKNVVGTLFRDITERKNLEKQLQDSERLAAIGATAGMVGHDIRNPLQAIIGDLYLAKTELSALPEKEQKINALESLEEIEHNIDYINKIVADLQDYARPLNPRAQETNVKSLINEVLIKNGIPKNIKVTVDVDDKAEKILADPDYLKRIAANLTLNAVQAMPNGGKLTVRAYCDKQTNDVVITVEDTGVGIPEDIKPKLFTPMMTTKSKGQGFGLAVVKRMTEGLGGTVNFESTDGKGTTFTVRLPPGPKKS